MGRYLHHAIVVTGGWNEHDLLTAHQHARTICGDKVTEITPAQVNNTRSFLVAPDGSKEGWDTSEDGEEGRDKLVALLRELTVDWCEVEFPGDGGQRALVLRYSDDDDDE